MIKVIWGRTAYEMIDARTRENGGVPVVTDDGMELTRENWDKMQAEIKEKFDSYVEMRRALHLFEKSGKKCNC